MRCTFGTMFETSFQSLWGSTPGLGRLVGRGSGWRNVFLEKRCSMAQQIAQKQLFLDVGIQDSP